MPSSNLRKYLLVVLVVNACTGSVGTRSGSGGTGSGNTTGGGNSSGGGGMGGMGMATIPNTHPRLFFTPARLDAAKQWFAAHPFTPRSDRPLNQAFHYLLTGNRASARAAIDHALSVTIRTEPVSSDDARWDGENVIIAYDWCWPEMTDAERQILIDRWNGYIHILNAKDWGNVGMEGNNYYLGYMRNAIEWGIATRGENPDAEAILEHGLTTRFTNSFLPYAATAGLGGVPHEGTQYGRGVLIYFTIPLTTMSMLGRDLWKETDYFKQAAYYVIYSRTPAKTVLANMPTRSFYETYPFNDDEEWLYGNSAAVQDIGTFLAPLLEEWPDSRLAGYIQQYLNVTQAPIDLHVQSVQRPTTPRPFDDLPLDYFAPGIKFFYTKSSWAETAMAINLQLGIGEGVGHRHHDSGSFQIARKGRWLTRETVSYTERIVSWNNGTAEDARGTYGHNNVAFQGKGEVNDFRAQPVMLALESRPNYSYAAVDLTNGYRATEARYDNLFADKVVREFLFIRPLETLVVLDRMRSSGTMMPAENVTKTFFLHSETAAPTLGTGSALVVNGDQALQVATLVPANPTRRVITEGTEVGQFRLELDSSGSPEAFFLNVLHGRDMSAPALQASMTETATTWDVTLTHPTKGSAVISLRKGIDSVGGSVGYAATGTPTASPLIDRIQTQRLTDDGPVWE